MVIHYVLHNDSTHCLKLGSAVIFFHDKKKFCCRVFLIKHILKQDISLGKKDMDFGNDYINIFFSYISAFGISNTGKNK